MGLFAVGKQPPPPFDESTAANPAEEGFLGFPTRDWLACLARAAAATGGLLLHSTTTVANGVGSCPRDVSEKGNTILRQGGWLVAGFVLLPVLGHRSLGE